MLGPRTAAAGGIEGIVQEHPEGIELECLVQSGGRWLVAVGGPARWLVELRLQCELGVDNSGCILWLGCLEGLAV